MFDKVNFETSIIIPPEENVYVILSEWTLILQVTI